MTKTCSDAKTPIIIRQVCDCRVFVPPLISWTEKTYHTQATKTEAAVLRQAIADADWDTVERYGVLDAVVDTIDQAEEKTAASAGAGSIDDFRLWGSRRWRRMGGPLTRGGWRTEVAHVVAHDFDNYRSALSEGAALAVVVQAVPGNPHWTRVGTDCPNPMG